jgi:hypothetical protein
VIQKSFALFLDHVLWYDGSRTTFLHRQGDGTVFSPSDLRTVVGDSHDIYDLHDLLDQLC